MAIKPSFKKGGKGGKPGKPIAGKIYRKIKNGYVEPKKARVSKGTNVVAMDIISAADLEASESENEGPKGFADFGSEDEGKGKKKDTKKDTKKEVKGKKEVVKKGGKESRDQKGVKSQTSESRDEKDAKISTKSRDLKLASDDSAVVGALGGSLTGSEELTKPVEKLTKAGKTKKELTKAAVKPAAKPKAVEAAEDTAEVEAPAKTKITKPTEKLTKHDKLTKQKKDVAKPTVKSQAPADAKETAEDDAEVQPKTKKAKTALSKAPPKPVEITDPSLIPDMNDWSDAEFSDTEGTIEPGKPVNINTLKWTKVDLGDKKMDFEGFYGLEECDGVDVVVNNGMSSFVGAESKVKKTPNEEIKVKEVVKEKKKPVVKDTEEKQKPTKPAAKPKKVGKAQDNSFAALSTVPDDIHLPDWTLEGEQLHYSLIQGLYALGYKSPTEIQKKAISPILSGDDVIGKASTGSGKTLAYGLPILHRFLTRGKTEKVTEEPVQTEVKHVTKKKKMTKQTDAPEDNATMYDEPEKPRFDLSDRPKDLPVLNKEQEDRENSVELDAESEKVERDMTNVEPPQAIIFAPTRELAHQITDHLNAVSQFCPISGPRVMSLTGGLSIMKQRRLMKWNPAIVVATPGRFHEFITDTDGMVDVFKRTKTVVMDEADRMLQDGHYEDLDKALDLIGRGKEAKRQTCVFSATFQKSLMFKLDKKRKQKSGLATDNETIRFLVSKMKFRQFHPQFVDANPAEVVARQVLESIVECGAMEKDQYLYYFLLTYPGKSIIFVNSIDSVKRLTPMLQNLQLPAVQLHSNMIQKARMRSLERFRDNENGILVATDVAARGLDIPNVHHVVHYHLPRTADVYVHRSGRTARAGNEGVSVLLCSPDEASGPLRKLRTALSRDNALAKLKPLSLNYDVLAQIKPRVELAKQLADSVLDSTQVGKQDSWLKEAAEDLGVDFSDFENDTTDHKSHVRTKFGNNSKKGANVMTKGQMDGARRELEKLLSKPLGRHSSKYITSTNGINLAKMVLEGKSHDKIMGVAPATAGETLRKKRRS